MSGDRRRPIDLKETAEHTDKDEGIMLKDMAVGDKYSLRTKRDEYLLERREDGYYLSGDKKYCPTPRKVRIHGSTWGGSMLRINFVGVGMFIEIGSIEGVDIAGSRLTSPEIISIEKLEN